MPFQLVVFCYLRWHILDRIVLKVCNWHRYINEMHFYICTICVTIQLCNGYRHKLLEQKREKEKQIQFILLIEYVCMCSKNHKPLKHTKKAYTKIDRFSVHTMLADTMVYTQKESGERHWFELSFPQQCTYSDMFPVENLYSTELSTMTHLAENCAHIGWKDWIWADFQISATYLLPLIRIDEARFLTVIFVDQMIQVSVSR